MEKRKQSDIIRIIKNFLIRRKSSDELAPIWGLPTRKIPKDDALSSTGLTPFGQLGTKPHADSILIIINYRKWII